MKSDLRFHPFCVRYIRVGGITFRIFSTGGKARRCIMDEPQNNDIPGAIYQNVPERQLTQRRIIWDYTQLPDSESGTTP